jgi:triacylglycerol esterase/lipase EstA (alpha/beta hydrolase family)
MKTRLLSLLGLCLGCASCAKNPPPTTPVRKIVLVHGFLETGSAFGIMKRHLEQQGHQCIVPKLRPSDGRGGLEALSAGLQRDIEATIPPDERFSIVAFSMGGIVSRHYLQHRGNFVLIFTDDQGYGDLSAVSARPPSARPTSIGSPRKGASSPASCPPRRSVPFARHCSPAAYPKRVGLHKGVLFPTRPPV